MGQCMYLVLTHTPQTKHYTKQSEVQPQKKNQKRKAKQWKATQNKANNANKNKQKPNQNVVSEKNTRAPSSTKKSFLIDSFASTNAEELSKCALVHLLLRSIRWTIEPSSMGSTVQFQRLKILRQFAKTLGNIQESMDNCETLRNYKVEELNE